MDVEVIWVKSEREYFCEKGWTGKSVICPSGNRVFNRSSWRRAFAHQREAHPVFDQRLGFGRQRDANWLQVSRAPFLQIKRAICAPGRPIINGMVKEIDKSKPLLIKSDFLEIPPWRSD